MTWLILLFACKGPNDPAPDKGSLSEQTAATGETATLGDTGTRNTGTGHTGLSTTDSGTSIDPGALLFNPALIRTVELTIEPEHLASLTVAPEAWVPATVLIGGFPSSQTAIRIPTDSSFQPIDAKPTLALELDRFVAGLALDGLDEIVFHNLPTFRGMVFPISPSFLTAGQHG